ncbi:MAG TPA: hypothetical protein VF855_03795 [Acidimicrobiales bacterium]
MAEPVIAGAVIPPQPQVFSGSIGGTTLPRDPLLASPNPVPPQPPPTPPGAPIPYPNTESDSVPGAPHGPPPGPPTGDVGHSMQLAKATSEGVGLGPADLSQAMQAATEKATASTKDPNPNEVGKAMHAATQEKASLKEDLDGPDPGVNVADPHVLSTMQSLINQVQQHLEAPPLPPVDLTIHTQDDEGFTASKEQVFQSDED